MKKEDSTFLSANGHTQIHVRRWLPEDPPRAVLQIAHGMVEFAGRYSAFASFLADQGYLVVGNDHLGHGESVDSVEDYGYFGRHGNTWLIRDMHRLRTETQAAHPDIPYFLMGHSMGSFLVRQYITEQENGRSYAEGLAGAVIMGTGQQSPPMLCFGRVLTGLLALLRGGHHRSKLVYLIAFGTYNKRCKPLRTYSDWLTRDTAVVDWVRHEEWCNFRFTVNAFSHMLRSISYAQDKGRMRTLPPELRLFFVSGAEDPVGDYGEGVRKTYMRYIECTPCILDIKLYEDDRHEILNELDKDQVYSDILAWLDESGRAWQEERNSR